MIEKMQKISRFNKKYEGKTLSLIVVFIILLSLLGGCTGSTEQLTRDTSRQKTATTGQEGEYKVGEPGLQGVVMTESLNAYLAEAEKNPVKSKDKAESITKEVYRDVTDKDGKMMPEKEMMVKLYQAQIYYNENGNSEYAGVNGLLIEEFGGRINKTKGVQGASERMNNIKTMYDLVQDL